MKFMLEKLLKEKGITKDQAVKDIGVSKPTLYKLCDGSANSIKFDTLEKICSVYGCTPNDLFDAYSSKTEFSKFSIDSFLKDSNVSFGEFFDDFLNDRIKTTVSQTLKEKDDTE